jgi:hypothetical protein
MQYTFAAVAASFLLFSEAVKAQITAFDAGSLFQVTADSFLPGATSSSDMPLNDVLVWKEESLLVEVIAMAGDAAILLAPTFEAYGFEVTACTYYACSGYLPMINSQAFSNAENIKQVYPSMPIANQAGAKFSEALESLRVNLVRATNSTFTGAGLSIGILSDSFNTLNGYAADIGSNDLPNDVVVLKEFSGTRGIDEGRAMAQLIHDLVPGAKLFFRTAFEGASDFALGIQQLADAGCDVIVDDIRTYIPNEFVVHVSKNVILRLCQPFCSTQVIMHSHFSWTESLPSRQMMWPSNEVSPISHQQETLQSDHGKAPFKDLDHSTVRAVNSMPLLTATPVRA